jgi:DNA-3-methyladenine glycosylase II
VTTPRYWSQAVSELTDRDATLAHLIRQANDTRFQRRRDAFRALARAIVGQQISTQAARSVWTRLVSCLPGVAADTLAAADHQILRGVGLSTQKAHYLQDLARHFATGSLDPARWRRMDDESIIQDLTRVKGIGRWTAEMFLIFHLGRPDILSTGDLGIRRAA